jgi:glutamyl-Q tRNA(Asp) synthetase
VASYLEARCRHGRWLLRIEDIDPPREQPGAGDAILTALEAHGFEWDGPVIWQSANREAQEAAIEALQDAGRAYPCDCSRRDLGNAPRGPLGIIYPGTCRKGCEATEYALRVRTTDDPVVFEDRLQGTQSQHLESESGDFTILRRDGLVAYQLAVVVDDHLQGITDIVRGVDLLASTPRQIWLQRLLGYATPGYCHVPIAINERGQKLSKSHGTPGVSLERTVDNLATALRMLAHPLPDDLHEASLDAIWDWAVANWDIQRLRGVTELPTPPEVLATS